jgi:CysZ protein
VDQLVRGIRDLPRGLAVLRAHRGLWRWVIAPAAITLAVFGGLIAGVVILLDPIAGAIAAHLPSALGHTVGSVAGSLLRTVVAIGLSLTALLLLASVAGIIAGPFNEILSEHVEARLTGEPRAAFSLTGFAHGAALGVVHGLRRLAASLLGLVVVFALGFVPVVGTVASVVLAGWLASHAAAYDCYDAVLARRALGYRAKLAYLAKHRRRTTGLGAAVAALLLVPGLNLIALGLGAVGATVAVLELERGAGVAVGPRERA